MTSSARKLAILGLIPGLFLATIACSKKASMGNSQGQKTFVEYGTPVKNSDTSPEPTFGGYDIRLQEPFHLQDQGGPNAAPAKPTALSLEIQGLKWQGNLMEVQLKDKTLSFDLNMDSKIQFNEVDSTGTYRLFGRCEDANCHRAAVKLMRLGSDTLSSEILYVRSYEYITPETSEDLVSIDNIVVKDAITYRAPVERHSILVDNQITIDTLVLDLPPAEGDTTTPNDRPTTLTLTQKHQKEEVYVDREQLSDKPIKSQPRKPQLSMSPNPLKAYNLGFLKDIFPDHYSVTSSEKLLEDAMIIPASLQAPMEPAFRIAQIARAFVEHQPAIRENACNFFVQEVLRLAGYAVEGNFVSNDFDELFQQKISGLEDWESRYYKGKTDTSKARITMDTDKALMDHGFVFQIDRAHLNSKGHVGIVVREPEGVFAYYSKHREKPPQRVPLNRAGLLEGENTPTTLYSLPGVLPKASRPQSL